MNLENQPSDNTPVFFTGLTERVNKEPKTPLLCILCGSSLLNVKNTDISLNNQNTSNGCQKCSENFSNLKKALALLAEISSQQQCTKSAPLLPQPSVSSPEAVSNSHTLKRKSLLPDPILPSTSNNLVLTYETYEIETSLRNDSNKRKERLSTPIISSSDLKRKNSFENSIPKRSRSLNNSFNSRFDYTTYEDDDRLSKSIWKLFFENKQTDEVYAKKMALRDKLHEILLTQFPSCGLYVVGSSMTGLGGNSSDMDMCLMLTDAEIDQEKEATSILLTVRTLFRNYSFLEDVEIIYAKVPILRFTDCVSGIEVDLNINNSVGIRNTQLLSSYARIDKRLPPLVLLTKTWARYYGINDAKNNTLSSYSLVLMVIHYLQHGCQPPVLPCLQKLQPDKYQPHSNVRQLKLLEDLPEFISENKKNLGDLFLGFLKYFAHEYDYFRSAMSVRLGGIIPKETAMNNTFSSKNKKAHWKWVCIEEPFNLTNTACAVFKPAVFRYIKQVFGDSWNTLRKTSNLNSIIS